MFDGITYEPKEDEARLTGQLLRVFQVMKDGRWRTLEEIGEYMTASVASISARLRDLRKPKFGEYIVHRRRRAGALFEYKVTW